MGGDLVEKQDRWLSATIRNEICVRENEAEKKRLLLTGRGARCLHVLRTMRDEKVLPVRAHRCPACPGITVSALAKLLNEIPLFPALKFDRGARELVLGRAQQSLTERRDGSQASAGDGRAMLCHLLFQRR